MTEEQEIYVENRPLTITEEEAQVFQSKLLEQQQKIDGRKQELSQKLNEKSFAYP